MPCFLGGGHVLLINLLICLIHNCGKERESEPATESKFQPIRMREIQ